MAYSWRGSAYARKGDYDRAIADESKAIELRPQFARAYDSRGWAYDREGDHDRAIADENKAIELNPQLALAYHDRATAYGGKGDYDREIADETKAIELNPQLAWAYVNRGLAYEGKGNYDSEIADDTKAIELRGDTGKWPFYSKEFGWPYYRAYYKRGDAYAAKGDAARALADFGAAAQLYPAGNKWHGEAIARVAELEQSLAKVTEAPASNPGAEPPAIIASTDRRLALVIGNSDYAAVGKLPNPVRDANSIAAALKSDDVVTAVDNLTHQDFIAALNRFSDAAGSADRAVIYFAGHGLQLDGVNYLIPVDARLVADRDVQDAAIASTG
jgi:hypothetical protein